MMRKRSFPLLAVGAIGLAFVLCWPIRPTDAYLLQQSPLLYSAPTNVGNTADTNQDVLQTYSLPAKLFQQVGDTVYFMAAGSYTSSTDQKNIRIQFNANNIATPNTATSGLVTWSCYGQITRNGASQITYSSLCSIPGTSTNTGSLTGVINATFTNSLVLQVTGQNQTNSTANTVNCQIFNVWYFRAPGV